MVMTEEGLKPLPLTVMNVSGLPAGTSSGVTDWIAGPDWAAPGRSTKGKYKRTANPVITPRTAIILLLAVASETLTPPANVYGC